MIANPVLSAMASPPLSTAAILLRGPSYPRHILPCPSSNQTYRGPVRCSSAPPPSPQCRSSRRSASISLLFFLHFCSAHTDRAIAANPFDKYVKRKKLDPLEAYVPAVLLTEAQFKDLEKTLDPEQPQYVISRSLLRSGPAASLRVNLRAVAQYATDDGKGKTASDAVDRCLRALEDLDSLLLRASRNDPTASVGSMRSKITIALGALDSLLQTVPSAVLDKGKAIADAYRIPTDQNEQPKPEDLEPDLKQLEAIL